VVALLNEPAAVRSTRSTRRPPQGRNPPTGPVDDVPVVPVVEVGDRLQVTGRSNTRDGYLLE
jgi:hypothetical protein